MYIIVVGGVVVIDINMQYAIHIIFNNYMYILTEQLGLGTAN